MKIVWSLPMPGEAPDSTRGDLVRARRLTAALRAEGHAVTVVSAARGAATGVRVHRSVLKRFLPRGLARRLRDFARAALARRHAARVAEALRSESAELLIETQVHGIDSGWRAAELGGVLLVLDDCSPAAEELQLGSGRPAAMRRAFARQLAGAALLVTVSEEARQRLVEEGADPARLRIVPNGVDSREHARAAEARERTRERAGLRRDDVVAVFVGSFQPWHRAEVLVEALGRTTETRLRGWLVGDGPGRPEAEAAAARLELGERCRFLDPVPAEDVAEVLAACDLGVIPDSNEHGHPMKLVEYSAAGLCSVAADVAPVRSLLRHGETGWLVPRADAAALASALERLARDELERHRLAEAARREIAGPADWRRLASGLLP